MRINEVRKFAQYMNSHSGGSSDYNELTNKPTINGVTVEGALTSADLGVGEETILLNADMSFVAGGEIEITDEAERAKIDRYIELVRAGKNPRLGFTMASPMVEGEVIFGYPTIINISYPETPTATSEHFVAEGLWLSSAVNEVKYFIVVKTIEYDQVTYGIQMKTLMQFPE